MNPRPSSRIPTWGRYALCGVLTSSFAALPGAVLAQDRSSKDPVEWVDNTGQHRVQARFLRLEGSQVVLRKTDGKEIRIPFERLSDESIAQAKAMASGKKPPSGNSSSLGASSPSVPSSSSTSSSLGGSSSSGSASGFDNLDAKAFVDRVMAELNKKNAVVIWDALPETKQKDIEDLVVSASKRLDSRTFDMLRKTRNTILEIARKQQNFILNSTVLPIPPDQKAQIETSYPAIVDLIDAYISKDFFDAKRLQKGDMRSLIASWGQNITTSAEELAKSLPEGHPIRAQLLDYSGAKYSVESVSSTEARVVFDAPGPNGSPAQPLELVASEGRWLPKPMVEGWDMQMGMARDAISKIKGEEVHQMVSGAMFMVNAPLQNLKNAKTQEEFDKTLAEIMQTAQGAAMAAAGGGAGMPPGGPPPGRGVPPGGIQPPPDNSSNSGAGKVSSDQ